MFQQPRIQLPAEQQRPSPLIKRSSSNWSIPCCSQFSIRGQRIQLPDDSDNDEEHEQQFESSSSLVMSTEDNVFTQKASHLSRNPFARASSTSSITKIVPEIPPTTGVEPLQKQTEQEENVEELADFSRSVTINKYENEPDWTEMYQDEEESSSDEVDVDTVTPNIEQAEEQAEEQAVEQAVEQEVGQELEQELQQELEQKIETELETPQKAQEREEKIPQIEDQVLHHLPLPKLSQEIPSTLIHKKASFERSMYGEQPLMTTTARPSTRVSRFSMTEEEFMALKRGEEKEEKKQSMTPIETETTQPLTEVSLPVEEKKPLKTRRSSIVSTAAQSILGDKLDDFTEKLAFIKKNIIMSEDSEDDEEVDNAEETLKKIARMKSESNLVSVSKPLERPLHRRASSLMDVAPTLARFMNTISGATEDDNTTTHTNTLASSRSTQSLKEADTEEELFDFTKVIEIGKNMKTFSEGFVGNGIRMFNDVATRMKASAEEEENQRKLAASDPRKVVEEEEEEDHANWLNDSYI